MTELDDILDDMFHGCAFAAYVEEACLAGGSPCQEKTRVRAYRYYEDELARRTSLEASCQQPAKEAQVI